MRLPSLYNSLFALCGAACIVCLSGIAQAEGQVGGQQQRYVTQQAATLQVTGTAMRLNISANHADVQDVLKLVFDQADKQFSIDDTVTGQVTMRLAGQPLTTVLNSICSQTFLRYRVDMKSSVFYFERDVEKVKNAVSRLRALNGLVREQLRFMGLDVPSDATLGANIYAFQNQASGFGGGNLSGGNPGGGAGIGGGQGGFRSVGPPPNVSFQRGGGPLNNSQAVPGPTGPMGPGGRGRSDKNDAANAYAKSGLAQRGAGALEPKGEAGRAQKLPTDNAAPAVPDGVSAAQQLNDAYPLFLKENNYVGLNTQGQEVPVTDLLLQLGRQANVPIMIDPSVPTGKQFRMSAIIPPRPLEETLNYLAPMARLNWRWAGNSIFVTTSPEFQLFWGESNVPRVTYPAGRENQRAKGATQDETLQKKSAVGEKSEEATRKDSAKQKSEENKNTKGKKD